MKATPYQDNWNQNLARAFELSKSAQSSHEKHVAAIVARGHFKSWGKRAELVACNSPFGKYLEKTKTPTLQRRDATLAIDVTRPIYGEFDYGDWSYRPIVDSLILQKPEFDYPLQGTVWLTQITAMLKGIDNVQVQHVETVYNTEEDTSENNLGFTYDSDRSWEAVLGEAGIYYHDFYVVEAKAGAQKQKTMADYSKTSRVAILHESPAGRELKDDMEPLEEEVPIRLVNGEWVYELSKTTPLLKAALADASPTANNLVSPEGPTETVLYFVYPEVAIS